ncbi:MAG: LysR family transcriptional regulator, partial [Mesorhizobium sp.]
MSTPELADHIQIVLMDASPRSHGRDYGVLSQRKWRVGSQEAKLALIRAGIGWGRLPLW